MPGLGTIVNVIAIVAAGILGLLFGRFLTPRFQEITMEGCGLSTIFIGGAGAISGLLVYEDGAFGTTGSVMLIGSLVIGGLIGEFLRIEERLEQFGEWLKQKTGNAKDGSFVVGFVTASLTICIGAMAIVGSIEDGIMGNHAVLFTKAVLDFVIILIMTASMGKGCIFAAIPVGVLQGSVTALARLIQPLLTEAALKNLSTVGAVLIFCVGINLVFSKKIKVGNLLPALIVTVIWALVS